MKHFATHYDRTVSALIQKAGELAAESDVAKLPKDREHYWRQSQEYLQRVLVNLDFDSEKDSLPHQKNTNATRATSKAIAHIKSKFSHV